MTGIVAYSTYIPRYRLARGEIAAAVGDRSSGTRVVAGFDEDTTTMAVEAARAALASTDAVPDGLWFGTTAPAYVDKTNATAVHAALGLPETVGAFDVGTSVRSGAAALLAASRSAGTAVFADVREGFTGGADERAGGDAAAAVVFGDVGVLAEVVGTASLSAEFLDRWRTPGEAASRTWEERFGEGEYARLAERALDELVKRTGVTAGEIDAVGITCPNLRAVRTVTRTLRGCTDATPIGHDLTELIGHAGAAHVGLVLADLLDHAAPGELRLLVSLADGADLVLLRTTERVAEPRRRLRDGLDVRAPVSYPTYLLWRGRLHREPPRRPEPMRPSAPFAARNAAYKFGFTGSRCRACGTVQLPRPRVCQRCRALDSFDSVPAAGRRGRIVTFTVDQLAFSPNPPVVSAVIDLEEGGRVQCELTDVDADAVAVGDLVELTFRRLGTIEGIHNYFWKARPIRAEEGP